MKLEIFEDKTMSWHLTQQLQEVVCLWGGGGRAEDFAQGSYDKLVAEFCSSRKFNKRSDNMIIWGEDILRNQVV